MKTDDLIEALVQDVSWQTRSVAARILAALLIGAVVSGTLFAFSLGVRPDLAIAIETWRFLFKFALCSVSLGSSWLVCVEIARPDTRVRQVIGWIAVAPTLLVGGVLCELTAIPSSLWYGRTAGNYAGVCVIAIPLLSIAPLAAAFAALRHGAPHVPAMAGAIAGLMAGSLAATIYATHCPDDSPLFVSAWYTLAVGGVTLIGALSGHRFLRW